MVAIVKLTFVGKFTIQLEILNLGEGIAFNLGESICNEFYQHRAAHRNSQIHVIKLFGVKLRKRVRHYFDKGHSFLGYSDN